MTPLDIANKAANRADAAWHRLNALGNQATPRAYSRWMDALAALHAAQDRLIGRA